MRIKGSHGYPHSEETKRKIGEALSRRVKFRCDYCGAEGSDRPSHYRRKRRHFCRQRCYSLFREEKLPPQEQFGWKGGITKQTQMGRGTKEYKEWRWSVISRDNFSCLWCGAKEKLEADHIKRWSECKELRYEVSNGRTLCMMCHNKTRGRHHENPELLEK